MPPYSFIPDNREDSRSHDTLVYPHRFTIIESDDETEAGVASMHRTLAALLGKVDPRKSGPIKKKRR
jgi:hypothetical protein